MGIPVIMRREAQSVHSAAPSIGIAVTKRQNFETLEKTIVDLRARFGSHLILRAKVLKGDRVGRVWHASNRVQ